jgi:hypothetical protein
MLLRTNDVDVQTGVFLLWVVKELSRIEFGISFECFQSNYGGVMHTSVPVP